MGEPKPMSRFTISGRRLPQLCLAALLAAGVLTAQTAVHAHHALAANYEEGNEGSITGVVEEVFFRNPHVRYYLAVDDGEGGTELWDVETQNLLMLGRLGWRKDTIKVGDRITVNGVLGRNNTRRISIINVTLADGRTLSPFFSNRRSNTELNDAGDVPDDDQPWISAAANVLPGRYSADPEHVYATFSYLHMGLSRPTVHFADIMAELDLDGRTMSNSRVSVAIDAASVDSGVDELDDHLRGDDFFNVARHPTIRFESTAYEEQSATTGKMSGDLTVAGVTRPITLDVTINAARTNPLNRKETLGVSATGVVRRSAFGLDDYAQFVSDELELRIEAEFVREDVQPDRGEEQ